MPLHLPAPRGPMRAVLRDGVPKPVWPLTCASCGDEVLVSHAKYMKFVFGGEPVCNACRAGYVDGGDDDGATGERAPQRPARLVSERQEYAIWNGIKDRCFNPLSPDFPKYGGRGIVMCREWVDDFPAFLAFMGPRPGPKYSVGRINNNLGYQPYDPETGEVQLRWELPEEQNRNQSHNRHITWNGETKLMVEWAEHLGISLVGLEARLRDWTLEKAMTAPVRRMKTSLGDREAEVVKRYLETGETAKQLAAAFGVSQRAVNSVLIRAGSRTERIRQYREGDPSPSDSNKSAGEPPVPGDEG